MVKTPTMNDAFIRKNFHRRILRRYGSQKDVLVLDELGLCHGQSRADIAIINGSLIGYEIKSDKDSLDRLGDQVKAYSAIFDRAILITGETHHSAILSAIPKWWGIILCRCGKRGAAKFEISRKAQINKGVNPIAIAQLLWKSEACELLERLGETQSLHRERRCAIYQKLAKKMDLEQLKYEVRKYLKHRKNWRRLGQPFPYGDLCQPAAR